MMKEEEKQATEGVEMSKVTLVAKIDQRAIPALDRVANTNEVNTAQLMSQFFSDISNTVQFLDSAKGDSFTAVESWLAKFIVDRCCGATPEALRAMGRIWDRAAEIKAHEGGTKG